MVSSPWNARELVYPDDKEVVTQHYESRMFSNMFNAYLTIKYTLKLGLHSFISSTTIPSIIIDLLISANHTFPTKLYYIYIHILIHILSGPNSTKQGIVHGENILQR